MKQNSLTFFVDGMAKRFGKNHYWLLNTILSMAMKQESLSQWDQCRRNSRKKEGRWVLSTLSTGSPTGCVFECLGHVTWEALITISFYTPKISIYWLMLETTPKTFISQLERRLKSLGNSNNDIDLVQSVDYCIRILSLR